MTQKILDIFLLFLVFIFYEEAAMFSQNADIDSLKKGLQTYEGDTNKVNALNSLSKKLNSIGDYSSALAYAEEAGSLARKLGFRRGLATAHNNTGNVQQNQGNLPEALQNYFTCLKLYEQIGNKKGMASACNGLGNTYNNLGNYKEALKQHFSALALRKEISDTSGLSASYGNIGNAYENLGNYVEALKNHFLSLRIDEELGEKQGVAISYNNLGNINGKLNNYNEALRNFSHSYQLFKELGDKYGTESSLINIGATYRGMNKFKDALNFSFQGLKLAKEIGDIEGIKDVNQNISWIYSTTGNHKEALRYYKDYIVARDSLINEENTKKSVQAEMNFEFDKKEAATKLEQEKKEAVAAAESRKQRIIIWSVCGILTLVLAFAIFAYRSYLQKQKANIAITKQKHLIEEKQKEILDSIYYAKRIQEALLPNESYIKKHIAKTNH